MQGRVVTVKARARRPSRKARAGNLCWNYPWHGWRRERPAVVGSPCRRPRRASDCWQTGAARAGGVAAGGSADRISTGRWLCPQVSALLVSTGAFGAERALRRGVSSGGALRAISSRCKEVFVKRRCFPLTAATMWCSFTVQFPFYAISSSFGVVERYWPGR